MDGCASVPRQSTVCRRCRLVVEGGTETCSAFNCLPTSLPPCCLLLPPTHTHMQGNRKSIVLISWTTRAEYTCSCSTCSCSCTSIWLQTYFAYMSGAGGVWEAANLICILSSSIYGCTRIRIRIPNDIFLHVDDSMQSGYFSDSCKVIKFCSILAPISCQLFSQSISAFNYIFVQLQNKQLFL